MGTTKGCNTRGEAGGMLPTWWNENTGHKPLSAGEQHMRSNSALRSPVLPPAARGHRCKWLTSPHWAKQYHNPPRHTIGLQMDEPQVHMAIHDQPLVHDDAENYSANQQPHKLPFFTPPPRLTRCGSYWDVDVPAGPPRAGLVHRAAQDYRPQDHRRADHEMGVDMGPLPRWGNGGSFRQTMRLYDTESRDRALMRNVNPTGAHSHFGATRHGGHGLPTNAERTLEWSIERGARPMFSSRCQTR